MPDEIDRLLDEALSTYASTPDRPKLEERVLARVNRQKRRPAYRLTYASAMVLIVAALLAVWELRVPEMQGPVPKIAKLAPKHAMPPTTQQFVLLSKSESSKRSIQRRHAGQKRDAGAKRPEFPTPFALTPQERALLEIAQARPDQLNTVSRPMAPLEIPLIHIELLDTGRD